MFLTTKIEQLLAEKAKIDAYINKLESLQQQTAPLVKQLAVVADTYREIAPEDIPLFAEQVLGALGIRGLAESLYRRDRAELEIKEYQISGNYQKKMEQAYQQQQSLIESEPAVEPTIVEEIKVDVANIPCSGCGYVHEPRQNTLCDAPAVEELHQEAETKDKPTSEHDDWTEHNSRDSAAVAETESQFVPAETTTQTDIQFQLGDRVTTKYGDGIVDKILPDRDELYVKRDTGGFTCYRLSKAFEDIKLVEVDSETLTGAEAEPTTAEEIFTSLGFYQPKNADNMFNGEELYETYRNWDIYFSVPNGGIVAIGLYDTQNDQVWDACAEVIHEDFDPTFPEFLDDFDEIVVWTRKLIDRVENLEAPEQEISLLLENLAAPAVFGSFINSGGGVTEEEYDAAVEEELALDDDEELKQWSCKFEGKKWKVQVLKEFADGTASLLFQTSDEGFTYQVTLAELEKCDYSLMDCAGMILENKFARVEESEPPLQELTELQKPFSIEPRIELFRGKLTLESVDMIVTMTPSMHTKAGVMQLGGVVFEFDNSAGKRLFESSQTREQIGEQEPLFIALQLANKWLEMTKTDTDFEVMGFNVRVYPQFGGENLVGATFKFISLEEKDAQGKPKLIFSTSRLAAEIGDVTWKTFAEQLIVDYQAKEAARLEKLANPHAKEEDKFVKLVKISNDVGYLAQKDTGEILSGYAAFSNKKLDGSKTETQAKARAQKWADFLKGSIQLECLSPRIAKRMVSDNALQPFAYEVKIVKPSIGQLIKLAEENLSLLPLDREEKQARSELAHSELKTDTGNDETSGIDKECLTDNEIKIVELIRAALSKFDADAVQEINSAEVSELVRNKVWESLSEMEQKIYELLLKLQFAQASDFSPQTPEFITSVDGKQGKNVFLSLRAIDGVPSRVWRYQGQKGNGGYPSKESAAVAAWLLP